MNGRNMKCTIRVVVGNVSLEIIGLLQIQRQIAKSTRCADVPTEICRPMPSTS